MPRPKYAEPIRLAFHATTDTDYRQGQVEVALCDKCGALVLNEEQARNTHDHFHSMVTAAYFHEDT